MFCHITSHHRTSGNTIQMCRCPICQNHPKSTSLSEYKIIFTFFFFQISSDQLLSSRSLLLQIGSPRSLAACDAQGILPKDTWLPHIPHKRTCCSKYTLGILVSPVQNGLFFLFWMFTIVFLFFNVQFSFQTEWSCLGPAAARIWHTNHWRSSSFQVERQKHVFFFIFVRSVFRKFPAIQKGHVLPRRFGPSSCATALWIYGGIGYEFLPRPNLSPIGCVVAWCYKEIWSTHTFVNLNNYNLLPLVFICDCVFLVHLKLHAWFCVFFFNMLIHWFSQDCSMTQKTNRLWDQHSAGATARSHWGCTRDAVVSGIVFKLGHFFFISATFGSWFGMIWYRMIPLLTALNHPCSQTVLNQL